MKKCLTTLLVSFILVLVFACTSVSAKTVLNNLCENEDITVTWSGTWQVPGTEGQDNPGTHVVDGDYSNKWGSHDIYQTGEEWVQITFSKPETINSFVVYQEASGHYTNIKQFTWQILDENDEWVVVYTSPEFDEFWIDFEDDFEEPVTCMAIRFHCTAEQAAPGIHTEPGKCAIELSEIELYQVIEIEETPTPEPTDTPEPQKTPDKTETSQAPEDDNVSNIAPIIIGVVAGVIVIAIVIILIVKVKKNKA
jgi:hypothetical protein